MTDIVERLRAPIDWTKFPERMFAEAADEIERLRAELGVSEKRFKVLRIAYDKERRKPIQILGSSALKEEKS